MKKNQPASVEELRKRFESIGAEAPTSEPPVYAQVNKPKKQNPQNPSEGAYSTLGPEGAADQSPQTPPETIYAPQKPPENAYDAVRRGPRGRQRATKLASPYAVVDLLDPTREQGFQSRENPLYEAAGGSAQGGRQPQKAEHLYEEIPLGPNDGHAPQKNIESVYAQLGMGAQGKQDALRRENPIYEGVGQRSTTPPPRSQKDILTTKLLQNELYQYGVRETQEWCTVVYGNPHALNEQLAAILENPQGAEKILRDIAENPESVSNLAGNKILGVKSPQRKEAEASFPTLFTVLEQHVAIAQKLHESFTKELVRQQSPERETSPERSEQRHQHRQHARETEQNTQEQNAQRRQSPKNDRGMSFAM